MVRRGDGTEFEGARLRQELSIRGYDLATISGRIKCEERFQATGHGQRLRSCEVDAECFIGDLVFVNHNCE